MNNHLRNLESKISPFAEKCALLENELASYPEYFIKLCEYKIFGKGVLALNRRFISGGWDDVEDFQRSFHFVNSKENINIFTNEYEEWFPSQFKLIGYTTYYSDIYMINSDKNTVHNFHVADVIDKEYREDLMNATLLFSDFLKVLEPQTICYLEHPTQKTHSNSKDYKKFEITDTNEVKCEITENPSVDGKLWECKKEKFTNRDDAISFYKKSVDLSVKNGYKLLRGPLFLEKDIENKRDADE